MQELGNDEAEIIEPQIEEIAAEEDPEIKESGEDEEVVSLERLRELAEKDVVAPQAESEGLKEEEPKTLEDYTPNTTYKIKDEEKSFNEKLVAGIKDKETEDHLRDLYTKADGLESYKQKFTKKDEEYNELKGYSENLTQGYQKMASLRNDKEFLKLQKALGIDDDFVIEWAMQRATEHEMPEEQRAQLQNQRVQEEKMAEYEQKVSSFEEQQKEAAIQGDINQLRSLVNTDSVRPIAQAMAARGLNFVDSVMAMGNLEFHKTGVEPSIESVVSRIAQQHSYLIEQPQAPMPPAPAQATQAQTTTNTNQAPAVKKPTIPSINGTGQAAVEKPMTMDELKALAKRLG